MAETAHNVVLIGSGNVATTLGRALLKSGKNILQVWSRSEANAQKLAAQLNAEVLADLSLINSEADLILIAVKDDVINSTAALLPQSNSTVVHTSGTRPLSDLAGIKNIGVFYPLQTFTPQSSPDFSQIPICVEGNSPLVLNQLEEICKDLGAKSYPLDSVQRGALHIAAVFANNFTNHIWGISRELLEKANIPSEILHPLMEETLRKALQQNPFEVQTGPAVRFDEETINRHLEFLKNDQHLHDIYKLITHNIQLKKKA
jgi:predicted short-subunit dehydrogenase-like oxidoreductase (DUF2520 family)